LKFLGDCWCFLGGTTFRTWKIAIHLGGLKTLRHIMWSFLVACPRVATWLRTKSNFVGLGSPSVIFSLASSPRHGVSVNSRHIRKNGGVGPHYSEVPK
jgi:hypothetical protein